MMNSGNGTKGIVTGGISYAYTCEALDGQEVKLLKEEKILMQCILSIVPQVQLNLQEEVNIYQMSKLICYLDGLQEIFKKLMIDEK